MILFVVHLPTVIYSPNSPIQLVFPEPKLKSLNSLETFDFKVGTNYLSIQFFMKLELHWDCLKNESETITLLIMYEDEPKIWRSSVPTYLNSEWCYIVSYSLNFVYSLVVVQEEWRKERGTCHQSFHWRSIYISRVHTCLSIV